MGLTVTGIWHLFSDLDLDVPAAEFRRRRRKIWSRRKYAEKKIRLTRFLIRRRIRLAGRKCPQKIRLARLVGLYLHCAIEVVPG